MQPGSETADKQRERPAPLSPLGRAWLGVGRPGGRSGGFRKTRRRQWLIAALFLVPALAVLAAVFAVPIVQTISYSFTSWRGGVRPAHFVGLQNYVDAATSGRVLDSLKHNVFLLIVIPIEVCLAVFMASLLRERIPGWRIYRFLVFVPSMISITIAGYVWSFFLSPTGIVNTILQHVGLGEWTRPWLADSHFALPAIGLVLIWRDTGFAVILFYSRLLAVDDSVYESAALDGAGRFRRMWHIDFPLLRGVITVFTVLMSIWLFSFVFNYVFVMTGGGPGYATSVAELEIYRQGFVLSQMGYASAISGLLLLITLPILILQVRLQLRRRSLV
jgi:multiple sugar transport system permease protein